MDSTTPRPPGKTTTPGEIASDDLRDLVQTVNHHHWALKELLKQSLDHAKAAGDALIVIKASLSHGDFGKWIAENCEFTDRTARRYIAIAEGWQRLESKRTRVRNLSLREAVKLLAEDGPVADHAEKPDTPPEVKEAAAEMDRTGKVDPAYQTVKRWEQGASQLPDFSNHSDADSESDNLFTLKQTWKKTSKKDRKLFRAWADEGGAK